MKEVIALFNEIQNTSSLNEKKSIIIENKHNELFKKCLRFLLDGNIVTGISNSKISKVNANTIKDKATQKLNTFEDVMDYLEVHNTGRDEDIANVKSFLDNKENFMLDDEDFMFYVQMITKKYKLGVDAKTVNKCISNLIPTWEVQLGSSYDKLKLKDGEWFSLSQKLNGCFDGNTYITMSDGSKKKIKEISVGDEVLSFDENTMEISKQKVSNVFYNGLKNKDEWIQIETGIERNTLKNSILVTKNHKIYTPSGWRQAGTLSVGDSIYLRDYELSDVQKSVLLGIGLGDGSVVFDNPNIRTVRFKYPKKIDGYSDFLHKTCDLFDIYTGVYDKRKSGYGTKMETGNIKTIYNIPSYFTNQENVLRTGYTFTDEILRNLTPLALAVYYIDDGSKLPCKDDGNDYAINKHPRVVLATHRHNKKEVERFSKYLYERYLITNRIAKYKPCYEDAGYQIELDINGTYIFFNLIAKFIPPEIRDKKLSLNWHNVPYEDWTTCYGHYKLVEKKIERIKSDQDIKFQYAHDRKSNRAYDIEVENNHTYFANGYAVHNCRASFYQGKLISRQGKEFTGMQHIISDLEQLGWGWFYDGELIRKNVDNLPDEENFRVGTGIINSDLESKNDIKFVIFDYFPESEISKKQSHDKYKVRRALLNGLRKTIDEKCLENVEIVPMVYEGTDQTQIMKWLDYAIENDWEGLMLNKDTVYKCKRTTDLIKIKQFYSMDLPVTEILEGDGRLKGTLGALVVKFKDNTVNVGSGFDDKTRKELWEKKEELIGRIIEVKYKQISKDKKTGLESLQFPIFIRLREEDKCISYD